HQHPVARAVPIEERTALRWPVESTLRSIDPSLAHDRRRAPMHGTDVAQQGFHVPVWACGDCRIQWTRVSGAGETLGIDADPGDLIQRLSLPDIRLQRIGGHTELCRDHARYVRGIH